MLFLPPTTVPYGIAKAFAYYVSAECLPQQRVGTIYVARKGFEDGTTVTVVKAVPTEGSTMAALANAGSSRIVRDAQGRATRIDIHILWRSVPWDAGWDSDAHFEIDRKREFLLGAGHYAQNYSKNLVLTDPAKIVLDPVEGLAFGSADSLGSGWPMPDTTYGYVDPKAKSVGMRYDFAPDAPLSVTFAGKQEMFRRVDIARTWIGSSLALSTEPGGVLLFRYDGTLAAYAPRPSVEALPGVVHWWAYRGGTTESRPAAPPPFALKGKLAQAWEQGTNVADTNAFFLQTCGLIVPTPISVGERTALLAGIDPPKVDELGPPDDPQIPPPPTSDALPAKTPQAVAPGASHRL